MSSVQLDWCNYFGIGCNYVGKGCNFSLAWVRDDQHQRTFDFFTKYNGTSFLNV
jgi:hypothetical protein